MGLIEAIFMKLPLNYIVKAFLYLTLNRKQMRIFLLEQKLEDPNEKPIKTFDTSVTSYSPNIPYS